MNRSMISSLGLCFLLAGSIVAGGQTNIVNTTTNANSLETAVFGGGCFWCTEALFQMVPGVKKVTSGFSGGHVANPTYEQVCTGRTGHAEVIKVEFDPKVVSYEKLLDTFWDAHDPTTLNRQGHDTGTQYRSIILYNSPEQKAAAEKSRAEAQKHFSQPIVTEIAPLKEFYSAEAYHQDFYRLHPEQGYCRAVIRPKVEKFEKKLHAETEAARK
ncbi:MAG TPA: peptide-methionine (S)-S-oxide reductase MsrA [Verrucomicrobiae bacterium]|nr:peptide-methionine (S)-S-oxide reductase MsrA [Verrucomicrobiae bacterium]